MSNWMNTVDGNGEDGEEENEIVVDESDKSESDVEEETEEEVGTEDESDDFEPTTSDEIAESTEQEEEQIQKDAEAVESEPEESGPQVISADGGEDETEDAEEDVDPGNEDEDGGVSLSQFSPNAIPIEEAQERDYRWRIMVWSDPSGGKSHFAHTMPEPIVFIDTESKAFDISHKFDKEIVYYQPDDYDEAVDSLHEGIEALDAVRKKTGKTGSIVVDSMSIMWEWSQQKYVDKFYPGKDASEVEFQSGLQGSSDWKQIKKYHNADFRQVMTDSPYNICWTAMREDDYEQVFDGDGDTGDKPGGEKNNDYKIDQVLRLKGDSEGKPRGYLQKSGFVRHEYTGLLYPTFQKHQEIVEKIAEAEEGRDPEEGIDIDVPYDINIRVGGTE